MAQNEFLKPSDIKGQNLLTRTANYLIQTYKQSSETFTYSTTFGQILLVIQNLSKLVFYYISDAVSELNIKTASRDTSIYGLAQLQGHNALRGKSAVGEISFVKQSLNISLTGDYIILPNYLRIKCLYNDLIYLIDLGDDMISVPISNPEFRTFRIIEGTLQTQVFTGTGESVQTYEVTSPAGKSIDDEFVIVSINGKIIPNYVSLYDIPYKKDGVMVKTGITSGIDIQFGNPEIHKVPEDGESIRVDYLLTNGGYGNIIGVQGIQFTFVDTGFDVLGQSVNLNNFLSIKLEKNPDFGTYAEESSMTALLAPNVSKNHIIHDAKSLKYYLERMNYFSNVRVTNNVEENVNQLNVIVLPKIQDRFAVNEDYFSIDIDEFILTDDESTRIINMLDESGKLSANISVNMVKPEIKRFAVVIMVDIFEKIKGLIPNKDTVYERIRTALNEYLITNKRPTKIPHSDIVRKLDEIDVVDTVKVIFVSEDGTCIDNMGNISVADGQLALIRGNFVDTDGVYYEDGFQIDSQSMGAINIHINTVPNFKELW